MGATSVTNTSQPSCTQPCALLHVDLVLPQEKLAVIKECNLER